jgi:hypothetical protein
MKFIMTIFIVVAMLIGSAVADSDCLIQCNTQHDACLATCNGPVTSASKIAAMHSVTATQDAAEHSPLRDKQRPSGKGYYVGEQKRLAEFNPDTCSFVLIIRAGSVRSQTG